jgi:hypothetical protein
LLVFLHVARQPFGLQPFIVGPDALLLSLIFSDGRRGFGRLEEPERFSLIELNKKWKKKLDAWALTQPRRPSQAAIVVPGPIATVPEPPVPPATPA